MNAWSRVSIKSGKATLCVALAASSVACGSAPPPAPVASPAPPPMPPITAAPDMSEVPEPSHLVGVMRWKNPHATFEAIYQWTGVHLDPTDLAYDAVEKKLAETLAADTPVDLIIALDPKAGEHDLTPLFAVSFGVRSTDEARKAALAAGALTEVRPGEYRIAPRHGKKGSDKSFCLLHAAVGAAPGRIVCGRHERDVDALLPYLTRTLPNRDLGSSDLHIELRMPPVLSLYGSMIDQGLHLGAAFGPRKLEIGEPTFDRALARMAGGLADELGSLAADIDTLTLDVALSKANANVDVALRLKGQQSWTAGTLASEGNRAAAPPAMFWHLPANATMASYQYGAEARRFEPIRRSIGELVDGWLLHEGVSPADRAPVNSLFADKYATDTPLVSASGPFAVDTTAKTSKGKLPSLDAAAVALDGAGWTLIGIGAPNQVSDLAKNAVSALNRAKLQLLVKSKLATLVDAADPDQAKIAPPSFAVKSVAPPNGLRKGSLAFEVTVAKDHAAWAEQDLKKGASKLAKLEHTALKLHLFVVPEPGQTWLALGSDRNKLATVVRSASEGAPESGTLASRTDTGIARDTKLVGASFMTLDGLLRFSSAMGAYSAVDHDSPLANQPAFEALSKTQSLLESAPHKGKTPMLLTSSITSGDALVVRSHFEVPQSVVEDVIILAAGSALGLAQP